jgi:hypothetical protein
MNPRLRSGGLEFGTVQSAACRWAIAAKPAAVSSFWAEASLACEAALAANHEADVLAAVLCRWTSAG